MKKLLLDNWIASDIGIRLRALYKRELSRRIETIRKDIVSKFQRKLRGVAHVAQWKATEFRFFLLYCGPVMLKNLLSVDMYNHFILLHVACRILCNEETALLSIDRARFYLRIFTMILPLLYKKRSVVLNMHNLIHVADDVQNMGCPK